MSQIKDEVESLKFKMLENYDISSLLYHLSESVRTNIYDDKFPCLNLIGKILFRKRIFEFIDNESSDILFFYSHDTKRQDLWNMFKSVYSLTANRAVFIYRKFKRIYPAFPPIRLSYLLIDWYLTLKKTNLCYSDKLNIIGQFIDIFFLSSYIKGLNFKNYKAVVVMYDASYLDNFIIQTFKHRGVKTCTLQHGVVVAGKSNSMNIDFSGLELNNSISDYLLVWNEATKIEALKAGIDAKRIRVLGIPKCIGYEDYSLNLTENKNTVFGIILDGRFTADNNHRMILIANEFCKISGYHYILRFHPAFKGNEYNEYIDFNFCDGNFDKSLPITEYIESVDFSLISNSTMLYELCYFKHRVYRYLKNIEEDKFLNIPMKSFNSLSGFLNLYSSYDSEAIWSQACSVKNISLSYFNFFDAL
ncbi:hypothetical protein ACT3CD_04910 [Geofilum sp. OHC36d9]|uniref:hypothetical protein n=1 Tax=Geofilum sp. OHC36d9 TaxID=3458413 RepID=UPI00403332DF